MSRSIHRRDFLGRVAAGGTLAALGSSLKGQSAADGIGIAVVGTNSRGTALARTLARMPQAEIRYICDVDERAVAKAVQAVEEQGRKTPKGEVDFRRTLDDPALDAVVIAAPDHWHAPATILACSAGKHVYVEKPCSHNPREGELMVEAARKYERIVQMGSQRRSWPRMIEAMRLIREGVIGRVYYSRGWYAATRGSIGKGSPAQVPEWLDFDLWQGPAPRKPYLDNLVHYNWHWFWHWGTGEAGNNGIHAVDLCRWGLGVDYPSRVVSIGGRYRFDDDWETPDTQVISLEFEDGKAISWEGLSCNGYGPDGTGFGASFHGEDGTLVISGSDYEVLDLENQPVELGTRRQTSVPDPSDELHFNDFLNSIRTGEAPNSEIEEGHKSTLLMHLGNIALRTGHTLQCDPSNGHIRNAPEAEALWEREYEKGWHPSA